MYVEFKKLTFRNILSYGNADTELDFETGLNIIKARNGSGKSTILDALTFVLYGKPYRNIKLAELVNRTNKKNMVVSIEFKIDKDTYIIKRGLKPTLFEIYRNNNPLDLLSSKKLNQDEIDKLLGINLRLFKNIVCIAVTNNKPFLELSIADKRLLAENIFNIDVLGLMMKDVKKRKSLKTSEIDIKKTERTGITNAIEDNRKYLENMNNYIANFNQLKEANISKITANIQSCSDRIDKATKNIGIASKKISELLTEIGEKPDNNILEKLGLDIGKTMSSIERIESTLEKLKKSAVCPVCNSPLDEGHAKKHIVQLKTEHDNLNNNILPNLKKEYKDLKTKIDEYTKKSDFIRQIKEKAGNEETTKSLMESQINELNIQLTTEQYKTCPAQTSQFEEKLNKLNDNLIILNTNIDELTDDIAIDTELINILGDDGIKAFFFKKLTDILNKNVCEYLTKFEMPIQIKFDETMQETISENEETTSYSAYSGGERCRIDMSILLSFFNISRIISNWSCNLLFIDEILDNGVDDSGLEQFIATLYNIIADNKKQLGIYIVSHKLNEIKVQTNSLIEIKKRSGFSSLEVSHE